MDSLLNKYVKCIDNKSISLTAKQIGISQPALSIALQKLEKELGAKLFLRSKQGIITTKIGELVYIEAKKSIKQFNNLRSKVDELNNKFEKSLKIGMIDNFGLVFLKNIWEQINKAFPQIKLSIDINNSVTLISLALEQQIDFGIITQQLSKNIHKDLIQKYLIAEDLILVTSVKLKNRISSLKDISKFDFYSYNEKSTTNHLIKQYLQSNKINVNVTVFSTSPAFIVELLKFGKGVAFLPKSYILKELKNAELIQILPHTIIERKLALIYHRDMYMNERKKMIIDIIQSSLS